jgi:hypothetical protein
VNSLQVVFLWTVRTLPVDSNLPEEDKFSEDIIFGDFEDAQQNASRKAVFLAKWAGRIHDILMDLIHPCSGTLLL